ncbi:MAG: class I SAM-dependent methyltransferase [Bauldia sp.]|nr:class I SAM-dependent methyltransferase [Bauldia sp.]MCW5719235.1 class I SAM-dependent methyltransferase [Bauldia sp.]
MNKVVRQSSRGVTKATTRNETAAAVAESASAEPRMQYRFAAWKDARWNSFDRQRERYEAIKPYLGSNAVGAEIGVYKGGFGEFLLPHCRKLYLVDPWYRLGGYWQSGIPNDSRAETVIEILSVYKSEINAGQVEVIVDYGASFLAGMRDRWFDFLYLDGSHNYEQTKKDLAQALPKMKSGGAVVGDDYDPDPASNQHGVFRAVNEFVAGHGFSLTLNRSRQWGFRVP